MTITLAINGHDIEVPEGASVLDAVNASGSYVPQLCKDPDMKPIAAFDPNSKIPEYKVCAARLEKIE
ncbi:MAG: (2Fe-2S)-binding protein [Chloroflexi bacterium]|nr:(2Fe-2S)-binding protein [Chloroflexota bacterium]